MSWLNKLSTSQLFGQAWIRVLISVLLTYDIVIHCVHIAGILNVYADALSRFLQTPATEELVSGLLNKPVLSAESRQAIWSMYTTPLQVEEYLSLLQHLEAQDSTHSNGSASSTDGHHRT